MAALAPPGCLCQPLFPRAADRRWYCVEISLSGRAPGARAAHAPGPTAGTRKASAPPGRSRPWARADGVYAEALRATSAPTGPARAAHALGRQNRASGLRAPNSTLTDTHARRPRLTRPKRRPSRRAVGGLRQAAQSKRRAQASRARKVSFQSGRGFDLSCSPPGDQAQASTPTILASRSPSTPRSLLLSTQDDWKSRLHQRRRPATMFDARPGRTRMAL
jgi:hypothetical protein